MATIPNALLICVSSPYAKRGVMYEAYREYYGKDQDRVLVVKAPTKTMNPTIDEAVIDEAYARDEASARAEYGAEFRDDVESFVSREVVDACITPGRTSLPASPERHYFGFVDPSGGSQDSMTMGISHVEELKAVLDVVLEVKPPFSPEAVVEEFCEALTEYRVTHVRGDRYGAQWVAEQFKKRGIEYRPADLSRSDIYRELLPLLNSRRAQLLDQPRLIAQTCGLERRVARGGKDSIDHGPGSHDDLINSGAGALVYAARTIDRTPHEILSLSDEHLEQLNRQESIDAIESACQLQGFFWPGEEVLVDGPPRRPDFKPRWISDATVELCRRMNEEGTDETATTEKA
jgi:hypothetical protein